MLRIRIITATALGTLFGLLLWLASAGVFAVAVAGIAAAAGWEWSRLAGVTDQRAQSAYATATGLLALVALYLPQSDDTLRWLFLAGALYWAAAGITLYLAPVRTLVIGPSVRMLCSGWFALLVAALAMQYFRSSAPFASSALLLYVLAVVWFMDIGAYAAGRRFGRHRLAPSISPGKTWEGVVGGLLATLLLLIGVLVLVSWPEGRTTALLVGTGLAAVASVVGDLFESRMKRAANCKDSSRLLPGHGGVLDRIDGVLAAVPVFGFVWSWL